ncbi:MAG: PepSY domain-containing protein [Kamptonema sp. SIO4C4]|nr:PepSY domain-containing protein [Kamptonema sp. SIO4C4]
MNKIRLRRFHFFLAPIMIAPILLTLLTGSLFQVAALTGNGTEFLWLLDLHQGKFGVINLEWVYPFLNAFGLLAIATSGIAMWWQTRPRR